jgi:16S rRNA (cytosine967-C5)-methyltransferase
MAAEILAEVEGRWTGVFQARERAFKARGALQRSAWAQLLQCLHRLFSQLRRVDYALEGAVQPSDKNRARVLVSDWLGGEIPFYDVRKLHSRVDWERVYSHTARLESIADPVERFSTTHSLPDWAGRALMEAVPDAGSADRLGIALRTPPPRTLRANTLKMEQGELLSELRRNGFEVEPTKHGNYGVVAPPFGDVFHLSAFQNGCFEAQDEASQLCCEVVAPPPKGSVLDACAGAGGKTLALSALLKGAGRILAADVADHKIRDLKERARRASAHQVRAVVVPSECWSPEVLEFAKTADRILVDAPCSGIGSFRRKPEMRWRIVQQDMPRLEQLQKELLDQAAKSLAVGARLIYSTCTIRQEENEAQVRALLERDPTLEQVRVKEILGKARAEAITEADGMFLKLFPHIHGTDGFFAAVLRKKRA